MSYSTLVSDSVVSPPEQGVRHSTVICFCLPLTIVLRHAICFWFLKSLKVWDTVQFPTLSSHVSGWKTPAILITVSAMLFGAGVALVTAPTQPTSLYTSSLTRPGLNPILRTDNFVCPQHVLVVAYSS